MYDYITGKLTKTTKESITIDVQGIGYKLFVGANTSSKMQVDSLNKTITVYVSFIVRENSQALYGFSQEGEREIFESLLNISGIGPKTALAIVGNLSFEDLSNALLHKDTATLCKVPGIGKKTAERLLIELKDTLPTLTQVNYVKTSAKDPFSSDAVSALINLGYNQITAQKAVTKALSAGNTIKDLSSLITLSLKHI